MSFFDGEACPDDNLKGLLSIHLKLFFFLFVCKQYIYQYGYSNIFSQQFVIIQTIQISDIELL